MGVPGGPGGDQEPDSTDSYYRELQAAEWVDGPSRLPDRVAPTEHFAVIYEDETDRAGFTLQFLREGVERGQTCLYVDADAASSDVPEKLTGDDAPTGVDPSEHLDVRAVSDLSQDGEPESADELFAAFERAIAERSHPERQARVVVEMAGLLDAVPFQELLEHEARLNRLCREEDVVVLSQYRRSQTHAENVSALLATYPYVVVDGTVCYNTQYLPPAAFFDRARAQQEVERRIETLRRHTETRLALEEQRRRNERLAVFANSIAHDLRNPLQTAIGRLELLPEHEQVEVISDALERMDRLIDDGLEMVLGDDLSDTETVSIETLATQCWAMIDDADGTLSVTDDLLVTGDRSRIRQLLENLFRNSIEYGGPSPTIRVGSIEQRHLVTGGGTGEGYAGFYVEDDGPGIPADRRETIFELGVSSDDGTGYGLAIVQEIVEAHGWEIHVTAGSDGGARFEITGVDASAP